MAYIANAKVGNENVTCLISSSFNNSAISIDLLKKLNLEYKKSNAKCIYIGGYKNIYPLGVAIIPILFMDKKRNFTIDSEIYVCNKNISKNTILLGYDWLVGGSVLDECLQIYSIKIVHGFEWGGVEEAYLSIRGLGSDSEQKLYKKIIKTYDDDSEY